MFIPKYILIIALLLLFFILLLKYKLRPYSTLFKLGKRFLKNHTYVIFFLFPLILIVKKIFVEESEYEDIEFLKLILDNNFLKKLSYAFVITGSGVGAAKYLGNLHFFKNQIDKVLSSDKFKDTLSEKIAEANFSPEYLSNLNNIDKKWRTLTLCKYQRKFPELMPKIEPLLENELFNDNNLVCYYHNFRVLTEIKLVEGRIVQITEKNFFYVKPTSNEKVPLNFFIGTIPDEKNEKTFAKLDIEKTKIDGVTLKELCEKDKDFLIEDTESKKNYKKEKYTINLEGKESYYVERVIEMTQDLDVDRLSSFSSSKIIDHMNIEINTCENTDIFFSGAGKNNFKNDSFKNKKHHYIKDTPSLPGDIHNIFIFKKDEIV